MILWFRGFACKRVMFTFETFREIDCTAFKYLRQIWFKKYIVQPKITIKQGKNTQAGAYIEVGRYGGLVPWNSLSPKKNFFKLPWHGQPYYIWISEPGQPFQSQFVLYLALWAGLVFATRLTRSDFMLHIGWIYFY